MNLIFFSKKNDFLDIDTSIWKEKVEKSAYVTGEHLEGLLSCYLYVIFKHRLQFFL